MEIKRYDIYLVGLILLHLTIFWRILSMITAGSALQMMSIQNGFGYAMIAIFVAIFVLIFFNLSHMFRITSKGGVEGKTNEVSQLYGTGQRFLVIMLMYFFLECVQALHYMGQISG